MKKNGWQVRIGANPIIWSNDDFHDLGGDIPLERCLSEMHAAGYAGSELGHKFPRGADTLAPLLDRYDLDLVSGWHSFQLLDGRFEEERERYMQHMEFMARMRCHVVIVAECSRRIYNDPLKSLQFDRREGLLEPADWGRLASRLETLARATAERGLEMVYHHHMGTVIQNASEIDELMARTSSLRLLVDTGHLLFADADPLHVLRRHVERVGHVHLKDVRPDTLMRVRADRLSFSEAVRAGVFTVPGDGAIDFEPILVLLREHGYRGWLVVEAEQDPRLSQPLHYARMGRDYLRRLAGV
ncbi:MAG: myo-inosose-2 dehydratase [Candidatus Latescibacterota bacterium]|nr:MAG: myo-inosose-2 dehydratase [Candidatus Latescibacterota bacterium]